MKGNVFLINLIPNMIGNTPYVPNTTPFRWENQKIYRDYLEVQPGSEEWPRGGNATVQFRNRTETVHPWPIALYGCEGPPQPYRLSCFHQICIVMHWFCKKSLRHALAISCGFWFSKTDKHYILPYNWYSIPKSITLCHRWYDKYFFPSNFYIVT